MGGMRKRSIILRRSEEPEEGTRYLEEQEEEEEEEEQEDEDADT